MAFSVFHLHHLAMFNIFYLLSPILYQLQVALQQGQKSYPLRPELMESTYWLYKATRDPQYLDAGRDMITSLQYGARCPCGYCHISDVESHNQEDHMESFFLAETVKYLWLLFDLAVGPDNLVENGPYKYIFTTEGHLLPATPEIALVQEQCSYFGSFCKGNNLKHRSVSNISEDIQRNGTRFFSSWGRSNVPFKPTSRQSTRVSRPIKGVCPGLTYTQKFGISFLADVDRTHEENPGNKQEASVVFVSNTDVRPTSNLAEDENTSQKSNSESTASDTTQ